MGSALPRACPRFAAVGTPLPHADSARLTACSRAWEGLRLDAGVLVIAGAGELPGFCAAAQQPRQAQRVCESLDRAACHGSCEYSGRTRSLIPAVPDHGFRSPDR